jgi:hypothetical protein
LQVDNNADFSSPEIDQYPTDQQSRDPAYVYGGVTGCPLSADRWTACTISTAL